MGRSSENGQALIELMLGMFLILSIFFFAHFASETSIKESRHHRFHSVSERP